MITTPVLPDGLTIGPEGAAIGTPTVDGGAVTVPITAAPGTDVTLTWHSPLAGTVGTWTTRSGTKNLGVSWGGGLDASLTAEAPIALLFDAASRCTHAVACSETVRQVRLHLGVSEEDNRFSGSLGFVAGSEPTLVRWYGAGDRYEDVLSDVARWWSELDPLGGPGSLPALTPEAAREPLYSTWYAMHQHVDQAVLDAELAAGAALGMRAVIVDDGWQTDDESRGYDFTGDWRVSPHRFPDLAAHVARTHGLGMAEMLWVALPFVGRRSAAARDLGHLLLPDDPARMARLWDVRLPAARRHVAGICAGLVADHGLDGLKIDFIDQWSNAAPTPVPDDADTDDYTVGVDLLLGEIVDRLEESTAEPLVEFRQHYIGPRMMRYGNMFRVGDCPANGWQNRVSSVDLRHLVRDRAVHADMVMWGPDEPASTAAEQLLCTAFSVPQISMLLSDLSPSHTAMLTRYLHWWREHRDLLLDGQLTAPRPDLAYPVVTACLGDRAVAVVYAAGTVVPVGRGTTALANASGTDSVVVDTETALTVSDVVDAEGRAFPGGDVRLPAGLQRLPLPRGGTCSLAAGD